MNIKKFKGTPWPWKICRGNNCWVEDKSGKVDIAYTDMNCPDDECVCNARLIAAAPELLEALIEMQRIWGELAAVYPSLKNEKITGKIDNAITKALGE